MCVPCSSIVFLLRTPLSLPKQPSRLRYFLALSCGDVRKPHFWCGFPNKLAESLQYPVLCVHAPQSSLFSALVSSCIDSFHATVCIFCPVCSLYPSLSLVFLARSEMLVSHESTWLSSHPSNLVSRPISHALSPMALASFSRLKRLSEQLYPHFPGSSMIVSHCFNTCSVIEKVFEHFVSQRFVELAGTPMGVRRLL